MLRSETRIHTQTRLRAYMDRIIKTEGHFIDCTFLTVSPQLPSPTSQPSQRGTSQFTLI